MILTNKIKIFFYFFLKKSFIFSLSHSVSGFSPLHQPPKNKFLTFHLLYCFISSSLDTIDKAIDMTENCNFYMGNFKHMADIGRKTNYKFTTDIYLTTIYIETSSTVLRHGKKHSSRNIFDFDIISQS